MKFIGNTPKRNNCLAVLLPVLSVLTLSTVRAQEITVILPQARIVISKAIEIIESRTELVFIYNAAVFDTSREIELPAAELPLTSLMSQIERQAGCRFIQRRGYILVNVTPEPVRHEVAAVRPRTQDKYTRGRAEDFDLPANPRPGQEVVIEIDSVEQDTVRVTPAPEPYSAYLPARSLSTPSKMPFGAVKVNLLYGAVTLTPNIALEGALNKKSTVELSFGYNRWKQKASPDDNKKLLHLLARAEYRYWMCGRYSGPFLGAHIFFAEYNISSHGIPLLFDKEYRYAGYAVGGGISYGHHLPLSKRLGVEFNAGLGMAYMKYDRYDCKLCSKDAERKTKFYLGPTRIGASLVMMIN